MRLSRSRLDFFLVSSSLLEKINDTGISKSTLGKHFDHKQVYINFKSDIDAKKSKKLKSSFLDHEAVIMSAELTFLQVINRHVNFTGTGNLAIVMPQTNR
jgi:hypothetical protein